MVLENLIGQFLYGSKGDDNKNSGDAQLLRQVIMKPLNLWVQRNNFRRTDACLNV